MSDSAKRIHISVADYLEREEASEVRHEYVDGQLFVMSGATEAHNLICSNLQVFLHERVRSTPCRVYQNGMKLRIKELNRFYYPDLMLTCEPFDPKCLFKEAPFLIAEVLSSSTQQIDRREKFASYKQIISLKEYLIVHQDRRRVELFSTDSSGEWFLKIANGSESIDLLSLPHGATKLSLDAIYAGYDFPHAVRETEEEYTVT